MSEFETHKLSDVATLKRGLTYIESNLRDNSADGLPYVNMKSFLKDGGFNRFGLKYYSGAYSKSDLADSQCLLIANTDVTRDGDIIGVPALLPEEIVNGEVLFSHHVTKLSLSASIEPKFFFYLLCSEKYRREMKKYSRGTTVLMLDTHGIQRISIALQPQKKQQKIVLILQSIDQEIDHTSSLIDKYQQIKAGLMHDLFTRGIGTDGKLRPPREQSPELYQQTLIGWIPKEWVFSNCEKVCEKIIDCKNRTPPVTPDGYPVIRTPNVRHGAFVDDELLYTDYDSYLIWTARGKPQPGDIVITREAPVGEICKIPERHQQACLGQRMMLYRPDLSKIHSDFLLYVLQSQAIQSRLDLISGGSTVGHVRVGDIRNLWVYFPKQLEEQQEIAEILNSVGEMLESAASTLHKLQKQKYGLMHDLLSGNVPVIPNINTKEATDVNDRPSAQPHHLLKKRCF